MSLSDKFQLNKFRLKTQVSKLSTQDQKLTQLAKFLV